MWGVENITLKSTWEKLGEWTLFKEKQSATKGIVEWMDAQKVDWKKTSYENLENRNKLYTLIADKFQIKDISTEWLQGTELTEKNKEKHDVVEVFLNQYIFDMWSQYFLGDQDKTLLDPKLLQLRWPEEATVQALKPWDYREIEKVLKTKMLSLLKSETFITETKTDLTETEKNALLSTNKGTPEKPNLFDRKQTKVTTIEKNTEKWDDKEKSFGDDLTWFYGVAITEKSLDVSKVQTLKDEMNKLLANPNVDKESVKINIESSSSSLPHPDNEWLARERWNDMKKELIKLDPTLGEKIIITTKIAQWPTYSKEAYAKDPESFTKYQYAKTSLMYKEKTLVPEPETRYDLEKTNALQGEMIEKLKNTEYTENMVAKLTLKEAKARWFNVPGDVDDPQHVYLQLQLSSRVASGKNEMWRAPIRIKTYNDLIAYTPNGKYAKPLSEYQATQGVWSPQTLNINDAGNLDIFDKTLPLLYKNIAKPLIEDPEKNNENRKEVQSKLTDNDWLTNIKTRGTSIYWENFTKLEEAKKDPKNAEVYGSLRIGNSNTNAFEKLGIKQEK